MLKLDSEKFSHPRSERHTCSSNMSEIGIGSSSRGRMRSVTSSSPLLNTMKVEIGAGFISTGPVGCSLWVFCLIFATLKILRLLFANGERSLVGRKKML